MLISQVLCQEAPLHRIHEHQTIVSMFTLFQSIQSDGTKLHLNIIMAEAAQQDQSCYAAVQINSSSRWFPRPELSMTG